MSISLRHQSLLIALRTRAPVAAAQRPSVEGVPIPQAPAPSARQAGRESREKNLVY